MNKTTLRWAGDAPKCVANAWQESHRGAIAINAPKRVWPLNVPRFRWYYLARSERANWLTDTRIYRGYSATALRRAPSIRGSCPVCVPSQFR